MYEAFYRLGGPPFRLTPDPRYLYLSAQHREALGHLLFGIREGSGFIAVTGEIGTGKTTLLRTLVRELEPSTVVAYIFNPALSDLELLQAINSEFRLPAAASSKKELVDELNRHLMAQKVAGARVVVIVDEAQNLAPTVLEQLRLLSNLETETEKLLQIVLVGQPELRQMLGRSELAQLNQRITVRWHLAPLDRAETAEYVRHRLRIGGGASAARLFTPAAVRLLYRYSGGVPRLINIAAHRALLIGFTRERRTIDARIVRQAIRELQRDDAAPHASARTSRRLWWPVLGAATAALALAFAAALAVVPTPRHLAPEIQSTPVPQSNDAATRSMPDGKSVTDRFAPPGVHLSVATSTRAPAEAAGEVAPQLGGAPAPEPAAAPQPAAADAEPAPALATTGEGPAAQPTAALAATGGATEAVAPVVERAAAAGPGDASPSAAPLAAGGVETVVAGAGSVAEAHPSAHPSPPGDAGAFWAVLAASDNRGAALTATGSLLAAWGVEPLRPEERARPSLDLEAIAARRNLHYLPTSGNLARLQLLNLPAILELALPRSGQRRFAVLTRLTDDRVHVRFGDTEAALAPAEIADTWLGDAHLFWRDFEGLSLYLAPGSVGPEVERLHQLLARVGAYNGPPSVVYDRATAEAIARFQRSRRLIPDGIVGPLTKIVLYDAVAGYDHPSLGGDT
jgi:general secretion pathway protein A